MKSQDYFKYVDNFSKYDMVKSKLICKGNSITNEQPIISIVIPTYRREKLLKSCIQSIVNQRNFSSYEIIIVDNEAVFDRITDTEKVVREFLNSNILYYKNEKNIGMAGNWNRAMELANSKWICIIHDDDLLDENFLNDVFKILEYKRDIKILTTKRLVFYGEDYDSNNFNAEKSNIINQLKSYIRKIINIENKIYKYSMFDFYFKVPSLITGLIIDRQTAIDSGGFNDEYFPCLDYYFLARCQYKYGISFSRKPKFFYRISENESLKTNILNQFIISDYYFRNYLYEDNNILIRNIYKYINKLSTYDRIKRQEKIYMTKLNSKEIFNAIGLSKIYRSNISRIIYNINIKLINIVNIIKKLIYAEIIS